jgi:hypothetical protein
MFVREHVPMFDEQSLTDAILAIEAEAAEPAPLDADVVADALHREDHGGSGWYGDMYAPENIAGVYEAYRAKAERLIARLAAGDKGSDR